MKRYIGGYAILDLTSVTIYADCLALANVDKPIVIYAETGKPVFADTFVIDSDNDQVIITIGGKTITIANDNTITSVGTIENALMENIKDSQGNLRFIEGEGTPIELSGLTITYNKWSLSGSHLMFVLSGNIEQGVEIGSLTTLVEYDIPKWIYDKIGVIWSTNGVDFKSMNLISTSTDITNNNVLLVKDNNVIMIKNKGSSYTADKDRSFRVQFDLLIDVE